MSELEKIDVEQVTVHLGGKDRRLVFGNVAAKVLQKKYGTLRETFRRLSLMSETGLNIEDLEVLLYALLLRHDRDVTQDIVTGWMDEVDNLLDNQPLIEASLKAIAAGNQVASEDPPIPAKK